MTLPASAKIAVGADRVGAQCPKGLGNADMEREAAVRQIATATPVNSHPVSLLAANKAVILRKSGLTFSSAPTLRSWEHLGRQLLEFSDSSAWWIADWLAYGELAFQDRYREAIRRTSLSYQTLRNYVWVARRFELSRRRDSLSFGHHTEVAALDRPEQDFWLRKAEELGWSRNQLRSEVRTSLRERGAAMARPGISSAPDADSDRSLPDPVMVAGLSAMLVSADGSQIDGTIFPQPTQDRIELWTAAAAAQNMQLYDWATHVLDTAARREKNGTQGKAGSA
jgi:hypothetical protein